MTETRPEHSQARHGSALARWPIVVVAVGALGLALWWGLGDLVAGEKQPRKFGDGTSDTTSMANLRAIEAILETVQQSVKEREFAKARKVLETAIAQFGRDQALRLALADLYFRMGRPTADAEGNEPEPLSEDERNAFDRLAYEQFVIALEIGPRTAETEFAAGSIARELGDSSAAIAHFASAAALDKSSAVYPLHRAQVHFAQDELDAAAAQLVVSISLDENQATAWGMLAEIALRQGTPRMAIQHIEHAVALEPKELAWRHLQARAFNRVADPANALAALDALADEDRLSMASLKIAGESFGLARDPAGALARYEEAIKAGVQDTQIYLDAAAWAERAGNRARAIELARSAVMADVQGGQRMLERLLAGAADEP